MYNFNMAFVKATLFRSHLASNDQARKEKEAYVWNRIIGVKCLNHKLEELFDLNFSVCQSVLCTVITKRARLGKAGLPTLSLSQTPYVNIDFTLSSLYLSISGVRMKDHYCEDSRESFAAIILALPKGSSSRVCMAPRAEAENAYTKSLLEDILS